MKPAMKLLLRTVAIAAAALPGAFAQLQLLSFDGTAERAVGALYDAGATAVGDTLEIRFHVRNAGSTAASLQTLGLSGSGFRLSSQPSLPYVVAPGNFVEFRVAFTPSIAGSYSATLSANSISTFLRATGVAAADLAVQSANGTRTLVTTADTIEFGRVQRGSSSRLQLYLRNPSAARLTVSALSVTGAGFQGPQDARAPLDLPPGDWVPFSIVFAPAAATDAAGTLTVDQRAFRLHGVGFDVPLPRPAVTLDNSGAVASGQQRRVSLRFGSPAPSPGTGTLRLSFQSAVAGVSDDPAIVFSSTGGRALSFTVAEGDTAARFGSAADAAFQTGTTAGVIRFSFDITGSPNGGAPDLSASIAPAPVLIDAAAGNRRLGSLDFVFSGSDNTYSAGPMSFTFYDSSGRVIDTIRADFSSNFKQYFGASQVGSAFQSRVTFPVSGDALQVAAVEVEIQNAAATVRTQRVNFNP